MRACRERRRAPRKLKPRSTGALNKLPQRLRLMSDGFIGSSGAELFRRKQSVLLCAALYRELHDTSNSSSSSSEHKHMYNLVELARPVLMQLDSSGKGAGFQLAFNKDVNVPATKGEQQKYTAVLYGFTVDNAQIKKPLHQLLRTLRSPTVQGHTQTTVLSHSSITAKCPLFDCPEAVETAALSVETRRAFAEFRKRFAAAQFVCELPVRYGCASSSCLSSMPTTAATAIDNDGDVDMTGTPAAAAAAVHSSLAGSVRMEQSERNALALQLAARAATATAAASANGHMLQALAGFANSTAAAAMQLLKGGSSSSSPVHAAQSEQQAKNCVGGQHCVCERCTQAKQQRQQQQQQLLPPLSLLCIELSGWYTVRLTARNGSANSTANSSSNGNSNNSTKQPSAGKGRVRAPLAAALPPLALNVSWSMLPVTSTQPACAVPKPLQPDLARGPLQPAPAMYYHYFPGPVDSRFSKQGAVQTQVCIDYSCPWCTVKLPRDDSSSAGALLLHLRAAHSLYDFAAVIGDTRSDEEKRAHAVAAKAAKAAKAAATAAAGGSSNTNSSAAQAASGSGTSKSAAERKKEIAEQHKLALHIAVRPRRTNALRRVTSSGKGSSKQSSSSSSSKETSLIDQLTIVHVTQQSQKRQLQQAALRRHMRHLAARQQQQRLQQSSTTSNSSSNSSSSAGSSSAGSSSISRRRRVSLKTRGMPAGVVTAPAEHKKQFVWFRHSKKQRHAALVAPPLERKQLVQHMYINSSAATAAATAAAAEANKKLFTAAQDCYRLPPPPRKRRRTDTLSTTTNTTAAGKGKSKKRRTAAAAAAAAGGSSAKQHKQQQRQQQQQQQQQQSWQPQRQYYHTKTGAPKRADEMDIDSDDDIDDSWLVKMNFDLIDEYSDVTVSATTTHRIFLLF
jgi:VEFS-Box of polycomb protein